MARTYIPSRSKHRSFTSGRHKYGAPGLASIVAYCSVDQQRPHSDKTPRTLRTTPFPERTRSEPNVIRASRRQTSPHASAVRKRCSIAGCQRAAVNSAVCCSVPCACVIVEPARVSRRTRVPSSLEWLACQFDAYAGGPGEENTFLALRKSSSCTGCAESARTLSWSYLDIPSARACHAYPMISDDIAVGGRPRTPAVERSCSLDVVPVNERVDVATGRG
jgi:hypothetical protein